MKHPAPLAWLAALLLAALVVTNAAAVEVRGRVTNGTTGQPVADQSVNLLALRGQMVPLREAETDAAGRFRLVVDANPSERFLVQVPYRGVIYSRPAVLSSGDTISVDIEVFDTGAGAEDIDVQSHIIFVEPHRGHVRLNEFYAVHNHSNPPRAYNPEGGSFRFTLPAGARELQGSAGRPGGASLRQQPQPTEADDSYTLTYAFKPGETEVRLSYVLPADNNTLELHLPLTVTTERRHLAIPHQGVELEAQGIEEVPQNEAPGMRVFRLDPGARSEFVARLQFDPAALESAAARAPQPQATRQSAVEVIPHPVNRARGYILGLLLVVLSLGASYLYSLRPALGANPSGPATDAPSPAKPKR